GYADFDWFSTEEEYTEERFFDGSFTGYSEAQLTCTALSTGTEQNQCIVLAGSYTPLQLTATFADGHTENVAATATYTFAVEDVCRIVSGEIMGLSEGQTAVTATYTDALGGQQTANFTVTSTFFPLTSDLFDTNIIGRGTLDAETLELTTSSGGLAGWRYAGGADLSAWKYLVIKLASQQMANASVRIYQDNIPSGSYAQRAINTQTQVVLPLAGQVMTIGDKKGQRIDASRIGIIGLSSNGSAPIRLEDVYVTNESDYSRPTAICDIGNDKFQMVNGRSAQSDASHLKKWSIGKCFDLTGRHLNHPNQGIFIANGKKKLAR
ncbi:MAG: hypothetical protein IJS20_13125, partial [Bacteroidales bacterium]|nr:hypothetical protein [Bacteroidales bacterium]